MHHPRLAGGLVALAVLLTLSLAPVASAATSGLAPATNGLPPANPGASTLAKKCLGVPYKDGGTSRRGFDTPGLTKWVYERLGVLLPSDMARQAARGTALTRAQLAPGDLVFYGTDFHHVGVYIGDGKMVDASRAARVVKVSPVFWSRHVGLRRYDSRTGADAAVVAQSQLGAPYVYGGASPSGFDCSGLTMWVYAQLGLALPHGATDQQKLGRPIAIADLRPGDLVFFGSTSYSYHVGIYVGGGTMIHAPHTGAVVSYGSIAGAWIGGRFLPVR